MFQIFAIDLISYLSLQYALPKSLGVAKLAVNVMSTMLAGEFFTVGSAGVTYIQPNVLT